MNKHNLINKLLFVCLILMTSSLYGQKSFFVGRNGGEINDLAVTPLGSQRSQFIISRSEFPTALQNQFIRIDSISIFISPRHTYTTENFDVSLAQEDSSFIFQMTSPVGQSEKFEFIDFNKSINQFLELPTISGEHVLNVTPLIMEPYNNLVVQVCSHGIGPVSHLMWGLGLRGNSVSGSTKFYHTMTIDSQICEVQTGKLSLERPWFKVYYSDLSDWPPVANYKTEGSRCADRQIFFQDLSFMKPNKWHWDFGDGHVDTVQNPTHLFLNQGDYQITLIAFNDNGSDTITKSLQIDSSFQAEVECPDFKSGSSPDFGIEYVAFSDFEPFHISSTEKYADYRSWNVELIAGNEYFIKLRFPSNKVHFGSIWVDWNADSVLSEDEKVDAFVARNRTERRIFVPGNAVLDSAIVLRVKLESDLYKSNLDSACSETTEGMSLDLSLSVKANHLPPVCRIGHLDLPTCNDTILLRDESLNLPTAWHWIFENDDTLYNQHPAFVPKDNHRAPVRLIVENAFGKDSCISDSLGFTLNHVIQGNTCVPKSIHTSGETGTSRIEIRPLEQSPLKVSQLISYHNDNALASYSDLSCSHNAQVYPGDVFTTDLVFYSSIIHHVSVWVDWNADGLFQTSEKIHQDISSGRLDHTFLFEIPFHAKLNTPLRIRIISDRSPNSGEPCSDMTDGLCRDFSLTVLPRLGQLDHNSAPECAIGFKELKTCNLGEVEYLAKLSSNVDSFYWAFDNVFSHPNQGLFSINHAVGTYHVQLFAQNEFGTCIDSTYIAVDACDYRIFHAPGEVRKETSCGLAIVASNERINGSDDSYYSITANHPHGRLILDVESFGTQRGAPIGILSVFDGKDTNATMLLQTGNVYKEEGLKEHLISSGRELLLRKTFTFGFTLFDYTNDLNVLCLLPKKYRTISEFDSPEHVIDVFPNPTKGLIIIRSEVPFQYSVYNIAGQVVLRGSANKQTELELPAVRGVYVVQVKTTETSRSYKVVNSR